MRPIRSTRFRPLLARSWAIAALFLTLAATAASAADAPDPVEGLWLGTVDGPGETTVVGLELARGDDGELGLRLTQPVTNVWGLRVPGAVVREGDSVRLDAAGLDLELRDGRLVGTFSDPSIAARFERVDALPVEPTDPAVPPGPEPRWERRLGGRIFATPAVAGELAFVGTTGGVMHALGVRDGAPVWIARTGRPIYGTATVAGDALYFVCDDGLLRALATADGSELWRADLGDGDAARIPPHPFVFDWDAVAPTPVVADGTIYVGSADGGFHALDATTGERRWRVDVGGPVRHGAAVDGGRVVVGAGDGIVRALDRATGRELWRHDTGAPVDSTPVVAGERVLVGNRGVGLLALDAATGERLWTSTFWGSWVEATPTVVDGTIYVGSSDLRRVSAIDPESGRVLWRTDVLGWSWGTPLVTATRIVAGVAGGEPYWVRHRAGLAVLDRETGRLLSRRPHGDASHGYPYGFAGSPVLAGDLVLAATVEGSVLAFPAPEEASPPGDGS